MIPQDGEGPEICRGYIRLYITHTQVHKRGQYRTTRGIQVFTAYVMFGNQIVLTYKCTLLKINVRENFILKPSSKSFIWAQCVKYDEIAYIWDKN